MIELDFDLLPTIVRHSLFRGLPHFVEEQLSRLPLPETRDRLRSASWLFDEISTSSKDWQNRGFLRAGLSEFRSTAQALFWDLGRRDVYSPAKSRNPLVHLVLRLRRVAVYVANAQTETTDVSATISFGENSHESIIPILLIREIEKYLRRERLTAYRDSDISRICAWFDTNQAIYGAPQVLSVGVGVFALDLCEHYASLMTSNGAA
jgi:hypothetical protein